jgi:uncharacterized cupin superfamily protein
MQISDVSSTVINWDDIPITKNSGVTGNVYQRTAELGNVRVRIMEYSPGYRADHWCCRGHVIYVLEGEVVMESVEGGCIIIKKGMSWCSADDNHNPHLISSRNGAQLFIID